jgi:hypothetical protein
MSASPSIPLDLKPMSLSELLDRTFALYRGNFWLFCGIMALPQVAIAAITILYSLSPAVRAMSTLKQNPQNPFAVFSTIGSVFLEVFLLVLFTSLVLGIAASAVTFAVSGLCLGQQVSIRKSYSMLGKRVFGLLGLILILLFIGIVFMFAGAMAGAIVGGMLGAALNFITPVLGVIFIFLAVIAGFALGFWLLMRFCISIPVFLLEGKGVFDSLARSGSLTKGHRWRIFVVTLVVTLIVYVIHLLFALPFTISALVQLGRGVIPLWQQIGGNIAGAISGILVGALVMIAIVLIYYDVRIRKEAFDLQAMMSALGQPPIAPPPPSAPAPSLPPAS